MECVSSFPSLCRARENASERSEAAVEGLLCSAWIRPWMCCMDGRLYDGLRDGLRCVFWKRLLFLVENECCYLMSTG
jgi:hypothetical protein